MRYLVFLTNFTEIKMKLFGRKIFLTLLKTLKAQYIKNNDIREYNREYIRDCNSW